MSAPERQATAEHEQGRRRQASSAVAMPCAQRIVRSICAAPLRVSSTPGSEAAAVQLAKALLSRGGPRHAPG